MSLDHKLILILSVILFASVLIIPKIVKSKDKMEIIGIIVGAFSILGLMIIKIIRDNEFEKLVNNYFVTHGYIENYYVTNKVDLPTLGVRSQGNSVEYSYFVDKKFYIKKYTEPGRVEVPNIKPDLTINYLVIYEVGNPENSYILLNYPIKNQIQLKEYEEIFKKAIPDDAFRNYKHEK